ncbi:MAG: prolyl oligopeptidase family serine peptidase [Bacteroidota bacterium]
MIEKPGAFSQQYPVSKMILQEDIFFETKVNDPYRWLEDDMAADTMDWVQEQNVVTSEYLSRIPFRDAIKKRLTTLWNYEKFSAPVKKGAYNYFFKNDGLQNQAVLYREKEEMLPEIFLDPNTFSEDGTTSLAGISFTNDGSLAAYQVSEGGSDWRKVFVVNTNTKELLADILTDVKFSGISWRRNEGFYYSSYDKPKVGSQLSGKTQEHKLYFHTLGSPQSDDPLIFGGQSIPRRYIGGYVTEDQQFLIISASNATYGNELYLQDLSAPQNPITTIVEGFETEQQVIDAVNGDLFILTNLAAPNRRLVVVNAADPVPLNWKNIIPENDFPLEVSAAGKHFFANYTKDAVSVVEEYSFDGKKLHTIHLPGPGEATGFNSKHDEKEVFYTYTSYVYPSTIFRYEIGSGISTLYKKPAVNFDFAKFESRQVFYYSKDGTKIPMIITGKKDLKLNGSNPLLLYGYGGFNVTLLPAFNVSSLVFMENGGLCAVANLRGGGEYGDAWHHAGTKLQKQNVFDDFIAAAEYLINEHYTSKDLLAIEGGSNGGLLVGVVMAQRPGLFRVCFPSVGVLDMLRYHQFTAGAGWAFDYGTAADSKEMFDYLYGYSPLHNLVKGTCYPATLITTADHDDRVVPAHSFKFAAALQAAQSCTNPVLISIGIRSGHGAGKPTSRIIEEQADKWSFLLYNMGLTYVEGK